MKKLAMVVALLISASPAIAGWQINKSTNRMTDKEVRTAHLAAKAPDSGVSAALEIDCSKLVGQRILTLAISAPLTRGQIGLNYRIDQGEVHPRIAKTFSDPNRIPILGLDVSDIGNSKLFRVELFPRGSRVLFFEFDIAGAGTASRAVTCQ